MKLNTGLVNLPTAIALRRPHGTPAENALNLNSDEPSLMLNEFGEDLSHPAELPPTGNRQSGG